MAFSDQESYSNYLYVYNYTVIDGNKPANYTFGYLKTYTGSKYKPTNPSVNPNLPELDIPIITPPMALKVHEVYYIGQYLLLIEYYQFSLYKLSDLNDDKSDSMYYSSKFNNTIINYANCDQKDPAN